MTDRTQPARWYMVDKDGMATLCTDREDAEQEAKDANMAWPHTAPHRAVQLVEVGTSAAELHPSPPEGAGWKHDCAALMTNDVELWIDACPHCGMPRMPATRPNHPHPPAGAGWTKASEMLPPCRDDQLYIGVNNAGFAGVFNAVTSIAGNVHCHYETAEECIDVISDLDIWQPFTPPTTSAGSKGE